MRSQQAFLDEYRRTHRNPTNILVHMICVPVIFFASVGMLWTLPLGRWFGLAPAMGPWVNGATGAAAILLVFYARLSMRALVEMAAAFALCVAGTRGLAAVGAPVLWTCAALWIAAWIGQFYGHHVEGAKPAFLDDLLFLSIGPLFVLEEFGLLRPSPRQARG
jgi:uncharacterized membrane protein YGL010W